MSAEHPSPSSHTDGHDSSEPNSQDSAQPSAGRRSQPLWSRRRFLKAAVAGLGVLAGACRNGSGSLDASSLSASATTPDAHHSFLPWVQMRGFRSALANVTPTPADPTATPFPTDTPVPTNTPRPTVTPFPPGPPSKLGLFITRNHPSVFNLLRTGGVAVVKTLELDFRFARQIKETAPSVKLIGRIDLPQLQLNNINAKAAAQELRQSPLAPRRPPGAPAPLRRLGSL